MKDHKKKHVHFVGIGGIGVSSLARYFLSKGYSVSGSDVVPCEELKKTGISVFQGQSADNVPQSAGLLIYSNAIAEGNEEVAVARKKGLKIESYPEALGELTRNYYTIAISGTHGKSTTTAMLSLIMIKAGLDPTVIIGTKVKEFGSTNFRLGESKYLLIEADEFAAALLNYYPQIAVITNIEEDHLDFYADIDDILATFKKYVRDNLGKGTLIINKDNENASILKDEAKGEVAEYSLKQKEAEEIKLSVPGKHNLSNALAAFTAARELGIEKETAIRVLEEFTGTWRRLEEKDVVLKNGTRVKIINDYAHHPTAIKATLDAVKEKYPGKKIVAVFQPHQYQRTYRLFSRFVEVLSAVDVEKLMIADIYTVKGRETEEIIKKVSSELLCKEVKKALYTGNLEKTGEYLLENLQGNEIVVIMGAGDVYDLEGYIKKGPNK